MTTLWNLRTAMSALLALTFVAGAAAKAVAAENDNDRSTWNARAFYEKLDMERNQCLASEVRRCSRLGSVGIDPKH